MEALANLLEKFGGWFYRRFWRWRELMRRKRPVEEPIAVQPSQQLTHISHFTSILQPKNFLDREDESEMLFDWLDDPEKTVGALIGIGGQGKTYLAAKFALECQQKGWEVRWLELPKTVDEFLRSVADEMQKVGDPYHSIAGDSNQPIDVRMDNAIRFLEGHSKRWFFVLDDFHKVGDDSDWERLVAKFDQSCERTKILLTARREPAFPLKLPTDAHELQDVPPLPESFAQAYLEAYGLQISPDEAEEIWEKCEGNCEAMKLFAQAARRRKLADLLRLPLPDWSQKARAWCQQLLSDLGEPEREAGKRLALFDEPVEQDLLLHLGASQDGLDKLLDWRLAERLPDDLFSLHDIIRDYWRSETSHEEKRQWHIEAGRWLQEQTANWRKERPKNLDEWALSDLRVWVSFLRRSFWHFVAAKENNSALKAAEPIPKFLDRWGEWEENLCICQKAYELAKELGDEQIALWSHRLAMRHHDLGDYEEAERFYRESLEIAERLGDLAVKATTLGALGLLRKKQGRREEAKEFLRQASETFERIGYRYAEDVRKELEALDRQEPQESR